MDGKRAVLKADTRFPGDALRIVTVVEGSKPPPTPLEQTDEPDVFRAVGGGATGDPIRFARATVDSC